MDTRSHVRGEYLEKYLDANHEHTQGQWVSLLPSEIIGGI